MENSCFSLEGTPYLRTIGSALRRALRLRLPVPFSGPAHVTLHVGTETIEGDVEMADGEGLFDGPSTFDRPMSATATISCGAGTWTGTAPLAATRRWTIYIAQDKHLDYGWIHPVEKVVERMNTLLDFHLAASQRMGLRWNLETAIWIEEYLRARPSGQQALLRAALREGRMDVSAVWLVPLPGVMGTEEHIRSLYDAQALAQELGIRVDTASLQEAPSLSWGQATILAGAGIPYVVKGALDLRNPHLRQREPLPLSFWQGPDGSRVLLRWDTYADANLWGGYAEAYRLWASSTDQERVGFIEDTVARYDAYARYPVDAILLAGTGFDGYPQTTVVSDFVASFNAQAWEYPRLVDATWSDFWQDVERQLASGRAQVPVQLGDWGTAWEEWPAQLAHLNTIYREARETVLAAQALAAMSSRLDPPGEARRQATLAAAWRGLLQFTEHDFGGFTPVLASDVHDRKAAYACTALGQGARALQSAMATLAASVPRSADSERSLLVANPNSWERGGLVEVMVPDDGPYSVVDPNDGRALPCQLDTRGAWPERYLSFYAERVPSFGYRCSSVQRGPGSVALPQGTPCASTHQNRHYRLSIDPRTGGLSSLFDLAGQWELADPSQAQTLNQYLHFEDGVLHEARVDSIVRREGPVATEIIVEAIAPRTTLRTTYRLVHAAPQLEIVNELTQEPTPELQCTWFAFPFRLPDRQYYYDGPAAILRPGLKSEGGDLLPGSGLSSASVQSFVAAAGSGRTILLATPSAHLVQFGQQVLRDPAADSQPRAPLILSLAMHNLTRNDHVLNQGGQRHFQFRYAVGVADGPFQADHAVRFAKSVAQPLVATWVLGSDDAPLPFERHAFLSIEPGHLIATGLKVAEDGRGWVLRLWECTGQPARANVDLSAFGAHEAWRCDLLERPMEQLAIQAGHVRFDVAAKGLAAVRFA
jgi:alpha-mannosidase